MFQVVKSKANEKNLQKYLISERMNSKVAGGIFNTLETKECIGVKKQKQNPYITEVLQDEVTLRIHCLACMDILLN